MSVRVLDGAPVHECGLCGARFGHRDAIAALRDGDDARSRGVEAGIWPLVAVLERLPGLSVVRRAANTAAPGLPRVEFGATSAEILRQLENLTKSLRLAAGELRLPWVIEVEFTHQLTFVLKPRTDHPGSPVGPEAARDAALDVLVLRRRFEQDMRRPWWAHASPPGSG